MVGAGRTNAREPLRVLRAHKLKHFHRIVEMPDLVAGLRSQARQQCGGSRAPIGRRQRLDNQSAECRCIGETLVKKRCGPTDQVECVFIAGFGRVAPGDQSVAGEHKSAKIWIRTHGCAQFQREIESGALPADPADLAVEYLSCRTFAVGRCCQCNHGIRVHVIDMRIRQIGVKRRIDRGGARVKRESAMRQETDHLVLVVAPAIFRFEPEQAIEIERGKAVEFHGAKIAARTFHPENSDRLASERVGLRNFGRRIAAAEIRHGQIGAQ